MNFVNVSGQNFNTIEANDASMFDQVAHVVREEPLEAVDPEMRGLLAAIGIQKKGLIINPDTSVDIYFGPEAPPGKDANWIQTIAVKGWFVMLRLYGPLEPWFDKTWRPGEIEVVHKT